MLWRVLRQILSNQLTLTWEISSRAKPANVDTMLTAIAPTTDDGKVKIIISYEDENGVVSETEKESF